LRSMDSVVALGIQDLLFVRVARLALTLVPITLSAYKEMQYRSSTQREQVNVSSK
jgi:hypothetical protein